MSFEQCTYAMHMTVRGQLDQKTKGSQWFSHGKRRGEINEKERPSGWKGHCGRVVAPKTGRSPLV